MKRLAVALLLALVSGCERNPPLQNQALPAVEYWPEQQLLFLATPRSGEVDLLRVPASPRQGSLDFVERLTDPARHEVLRLAVDRARGRLWVADRNAIYVYPLRPRGPSKQISFGKEASIADFVIDAEGNGYAFLASGAQIYRIAPESLQSEKWFETTYASSKSAALPGNRSLATKDGRQVLFQSPRDGALLRLDLASKKASKIKRETPVALDCAILLWKDDWGGDTFDSVATHPLNASISAFHCRGRWVGEIKLDTTLSMSKERYVSSSP